jgi:hypothetical protein
MSINIILNLFNHVGLSVICFSKGRVYKNITHAYRNYTNTIIIYKISLYIVVMSLSKLFHDTAPL